MMSLTLNKNNNKTIMILLQLWQVISVHISRQTFFIIPPLKPLKDCVMTELITQWLSITHNFSWGHIADCSYFLPRFIGTGPPHRCCTSLWRLSWFNGVQFAQIGVCHREMAARHARSSFFNRFTAQQDHCIVLSAVSTNYMVHLRFWG